MLSTSDFSRIRSTCTHVTTITDTDDGRRWEIYRQPDQDAARYCYIYAEYFAALGWRDTASDTNISRDLIADEFDIAV